MNVVDPDAAAALRAQARGVHVRALGFAAIATGVAFLLP